MIAKPNLIEAAPYYFTYINRIADGTDVISELHCQLGESTTIFSRISEEQSLYRYAADKWSIRQVLSHINDAERVFTFRAFWFARGFESTLPSFEQELAVSGAEADKISWAVHTNEFRTVRLSTISLFENMPAHAWLRSGIASGNRFTVRALAYVICGHFIHHVSLLRERYL